MEITVNGRALTQPDSLSIAGLLDNLTLDPLRSVIELNGAIVERAKFADTVLTDGDRLEIVRFVGGG